MTPKDTVKALYAAYASRDPQRITALLHEDVAWVAPAGNATQVALGLGRAGDAGAPRGDNNLDRQRIVQFIAHNLDRLFRNVKNDFRLMVGEGDTVIAEQRFSGLLPDGRPYVNDYCFIFEVRDGKVAQIREYMDTRGGWAQVFGDAPPRTLVEFIER